VYKRIHNLKKKMTKKKLILGIFVIMILITTTYADECDDSISVVELPDLYPGNNPSVISYTSIPSSLGVRNWDIWIVDSKNNKVALLQTQLSNNTYTMEVKWQITDNYLNGLHAIHSKITVLNPNNLSQLICEEKTIREVQVHTNRSSYNDMDLRLELLPQYQTWVYSEKRNITIGNMKIPLQVSLTNIPPQSNVIIGNLTINTTKESNITITPDKPIWDYQDLYTLLIMMQQQENINKRLSEDVPNKITDIESLLNEKINLISGEKDNALERERNRTAEIIEDISEYISARDACISERDSCLDENQRLRNSIDSIDLGRWNFWISCIFGGVVTLLIVIYWAKKKRDE